MATARARRKVRKVRDKWKEKVWYEIYATPEFGGVFIGYTPANDPSLVLGRVAETSLKDLTGDPTKHMHRIYFKIFGITGNKAIAQYYGHDTTREFMKAQVRRRMSKVDVILDVTTQDNYKVRTKVSVLTARRAHTRQKSDIRKKAEEIIKNMAKEKTFPQYVQAMLFGEMAEKIKEECKKIFPIRNVIVYKSEVLSLAKKEENEGYIKEEE
ncbi:30S ribosomal protein S3ae [Methanocaldococcus infernus]|uniref:Small ribosomal subunit protein eS1 n=1 Tax=Methanocaldococcus infernus (strain DSM 11812 / JCM 15783 / ME) TaxID=573063 RepID=D5VTY3_METIM|nr:30S ribosomal protein S3ae [Methanocaldococcus infernus]ADG14036.1 ribosomal protein S3Ae [Methanocaldococcus infernus ME]